VRLPPGASARLLLPYRFAGRPWPDSDYRLLASATVSDRSVGGDSTEVPVRFRKPRIRGRTGVRIQLRVSRAASRTGIITVRGRTLPRLRRKRLLIRYARIASRSRIHTLALVRTDRHGRFRVRGRLPARKGTYEVWARFRNGTGRGPFGDHSCAWNVLVR